MYDIELASTQLILARRSSVGCVRTVQRIPKEIRRNWQWANGQLSAGSVSIRRPFRPESVRNSAGIDLATSWLYLLFDLQLLKTSYVRHKTWTEILEMSSHVECRTTATPWKAVQVCTNREARVAEQLASRSLEHYLPTYRQKSRWTDRTVTLVRPLFPGYLFVRFIPANRISLLSIPGIIRLVGCEGSGLIPCEEIEKIQAALAEGYLLEPHPGIEKGTMVRIQRGIFAGAEGRVTELRHNCKVVLALSAVEHCFSVEVKLDEISVI
jgi:transcription antitermination factor NusG